MNEFFNKIKWVINLFYSKHKEEFEGDLIFSFHKGSLSEKYKEQKIKYAEDER